VVRGLALRTLILVVPALVLPCRVAAGEAGKLRVAVTGLPARIESDTRISLIAASYLTSDLERSGRYEVIAAGRLLQKLPSDLRPRLGCFADACLIDIGSAVNADYVVGGSLDRDGATLAIEVKIIDVTKGAVISRAIEPLPSMADQAVQDGLARLCNRLFLPDERFPGSGGEVRSGPGKVKGEGGRVWSWVVGGAGLALSLVASGLLVAADRDFKDAEDLIDRARPPNIEGITYDQIRDHEIEGRNLEQAGWVLFGVGLAALAGSVVLFIVEPGAADGPEEQDPNAPPPNAPGAIAPWLDPDGGGLVVQGRF